MGYARWQASAAVLLRLDLRRATTPKSEHLKIGNVSTAKRIFVFVRV
jgi:hypothetical protein